MSSGKEQGRGKWFVPAPRKRAKMVAIGSFRGDLTFLRQKAAI
jgi:hypothetical protein